MIEKTIFFNTLKPKQIKNEIGLPVLNTVIDNFIERVASGEHTRIDDIITEVAFDNTSKYTDDLIKNCSTIQMMSIINDTIKEFGKFNNIEELYRTSEYNYFYSKLYEHSEALVKNSLVEYLKNKSITINANENEIDNITIEINKNIRKLIDNFHFNKDMTAKSIIDNFTISICSELEKHYDEKTEIRFSEEDDEAENENQILFFEVGEPPVILNLSSDSEKRLEQLQMLCGGIIQTISVISKDDTGVDLVMHDEGKLLNLPFNKPLRLSHIDEESSEEVFDYIAGNFCAVGVDFAEGEFTGLSKKNLEFWKNQFENEKLYFIGSKYLENEGNFKFHSEQKSRNIEKNEMDFSDDYEER